MQQGLCSKPAVKPDTPFLALDSDGGEAMPGLPCKIFLDGVMAIPKLDGVDPPYPAAPQAPGKQVSGGVVARPP